MLKIPIILKESWDSENEEFLYETFELELEHSLVSLSKWESIYKKAFLGPVEKTPEELLGYVRAMHMGPEIPPGFLEKLDAAQVKQINDYIEDSMSATTFRSLGDEPKSREIITSELIYYWMFSLQIPLEVEHWHLNRLFTLIRVYNVKNSKQKRVNTADAAEERSRLNAQRRAQHNTSG